VLQFVESKHHKMQLVVGGYYFYKTNAYKGKDMWRCCMYDKNKCLARCHTLDGHIIYFANYHNHKPPIKQF
ncbi:hypothetical protein L9F63_004920, partial [Diploptera punctata]